jgi:lipase chaperone LimK
MRSQAGDSYSTGNRDPFVAPAIRDTLPYFLGAVDEQKLAREQLLREAIRELNLLEAAG